MAKIQVETSQTTVIDLLLQQQQAIQELRQEVVDQGRKLDVLFVFAEDKIDGRIVQLVELLKNQREQLARLDGALRVALSSESL